ncbi:hypothetical protein P3W85_01115 [Cupriavidus basilensis]|uniref:Peptidase M14 n=1 Tax=Cupriavidus basilensis TaxID=68895 RepID=A0ABT6AID8_9BURK|nr:hypothetical protein [Cupriavidus basilensis]MDF3831566.1 hypothetical protein [Cupriavidus basilensis]
MTILLDARIARTLDALTERLTAMPGSRVEAWVFEDADARRAAALRLADAGVTAVIRSAYKPLLHFFLDELGLDGDGTGIAGVRRIAVRTPAAGTRAQAQRFRLETYPLAGMLPEGRLSLDQGDADGHYSVELDGAVHRVFVPLAASGAPCGWLRLWQGDICLEDGPLATEFELGFAAAMAAIRNHGWSRQAPYFDVLRIAIDTGGIERALSYQDECISTREALHEDLYFSVLEFFQDRAGLPRGDRTLQPGQIVPDIRPCDGATRIRMELLPHPRAAAAEDDTATTALRADALAVLPRPLTPDEAALAMHALGGKRFQANSTQGRLVHGTCIEGALPGLVISAGQHANESSGVVGALRAAHALALHPGAHFALVAMENPDGAALHARLREDNPRHMSHAARYTALGDDLEARMAPPFGEKAARLEAIARTGAGLHLSLHGYPAHEWTRPLTGYVPPGFENWTLPKGFFLILRHHAGRDGMAFMHALTAQLAASPELAAFNARQLATWGRHAGEVPFPVLNGIPCMIVEDHRSTVPFTLVTEFPDQTIYGDAFRLAHTTQMRAVLGAAELYWAGLLD